MSARIRVGVGGWTYAPWRGVFYPAGLTQKDELRHASHHLSSIEINGTFYGSQKPATFAKWRDETPDDFVFAVKAPRYATHRGKLGEAGATIERFLNGGVRELGPKFGPINWQLMPTTKFDAADMEAFLKLLPPEVAGHRVRHAIEVRHESFACEEFVQLARRFGIAVIVAGDAPYPQIGDVTADFVYLRIMGTRDGEALGYPAAALDGWATRARAYLAGGAPADLAQAGTSAAPVRARDVYLYVISGHKAANPSAAGALLERLGTHAPQGSVAATSPRSATRTKAASTKVAKKAPKARTRQRGTRKGRGTR